jgi:hypothetical protein
MKKERIKELYSDVKDFCIRHSLDQFSDYNEYFSWYWGKNSSVPLIEAKESIMNLYKYSVCVRRNLAITDFSRKLAEEFDFNRKYNSQEEIFEAFNNYYLGYMIRHYTYSSPNWNEILLEL